MKAREIFMYVLGGLIVLGFFITLFYLIYTGIYQSTIQLVVGALIAAFSAVVGYFYGSSKGSADKTEIMKKDMK